MSLSHCKNCVFGMSRYDTDIKAVLHYPFWPDCAEQRVIRIQLIEWFDICRTYRMLAGGD